MNILILAIEDLLEAYERATPDIDQALVRRVLAAREWAVRFGRVYGRIGFGILVIGFFMNAGN